MTQVSSSAELATALAGGATAIELLAGDYSAAVIITRGVTITLAAGVDMDEAAVTAPWTINTTSQVIIDGVKFLDDRAYTLNLSDRYTALEVVQHSTAPGGHKILNSVFERDPPSDPSGYTGDFVGASAQPTHRAVSIAAVGAGAQITIEGDTFTGGNADNPYAGDSWRTAVYSRGGEGETFITGNTFENSRTAINADNFSDTVHITDNSFHDLGSGVSVGVGSDTDIATITGNVFGADIPDTINFQNLATPVDFDASANTFADGTPARITYGAGDDTITLTPHGDVVIGGGGVDTVVVGGAATFAPSSIADTPPTPAWAVANNGSTDLLTGVEVVEHGGGRTLLVGSGGFATIQAAVDAAQTGDHILIASGAYEENVVVNKAGVTLEGVGNVTIKGTFQSDNPTFTSGDLSDWIATTQSYNGAAGAGVTIQASDVTLKNITIDDFLQGVKFDTDVSDIAIVDVDISNSMNGLEKTTGADVNGLTVTGGSITDGYQGAYFAKDAAHADNGLLTNVVIDGVRFEHLTAKGLYTETLSNAVIRDIVMNDVAVFGRGDASGVAGEVGSGIELNLKAGAYSNIRIEGFEFHDVGTSNGGGTPHFGAGAISIKVRVDGAYASVPATISDAVVIKDGVIDGTSTGVRVGEYNSTGVLAGTGVNLAIEGVSITGETTTGGHGDFVNDTTATITIDYLGSRPSYSVGGDHDANLVFHDNNPPPPADPDPVGPVDTGPPPPDNGQGPGDQTPAEQVGTGFGNVTGVDPDSEKATSPTITLPTGEEVSNPVYEEAQHLAAIVDQFEAGLITEAEVIDVMVEFATDTTAVALQAYQFFAGATPTAEGVAYLVNSEDNPTDLTDPYYAAFSPDNRYINFAANLGVHGEGAEAFEAEYGGLSFEESIRSAYDKIIGLDQAEAAGIDVGAAVAYIQAQLAYFQALGGGDLGAKAAMIGYLMYAGMQAKVGTYYDGTRAFLTDAFHGEAEYNVDLTGVAAASNSVLEHGLN